MWEHIMMAHFTQSQFCIIRVSTEVFQTMQSLSSDDDSASANLELERGRITPKTSQRFTQIGLLALRTACSTSVHPPEMDTS